MADQGPRRDEAGLSYEAAAARGEAYWCASQERVIQHWYVSICLMMSAAQDHLTGDSLLSEGNLNWSASASYYSLVHTARLLCFLAWGDFPSNHQSLRNALAETHSDRAPLDWLHRFAPPEMGGVTGSALVRRGEALPELFARTETWAPGSADDVSKLGRQLVALGALRNDSNYEALLIAHEKHHNYIAEPFRSLAQSAHRCSTESVDFAIRLFTGYIARGSWWAGERRHIAALTEFYAMRRFEWPLIEKFPEYRSRILALARDVQGHDLRPVQDEEYVIRPEIEPLIGYDRFDSKAHLMEEFMRRVEALGRVTPPETGSG